MPEPPKNIWDSCDLNSIISGIEIAFITSALIKTRGNIANAARILGLSRTGLDWKIRKLNISKETYR